jgi:CHAD domain-containing protein
MRRSDDCVDQHPDAGRRPARHELLQADGAIKTFAQGRLERLRRRLLKAAHDMSTLSPDKLHRIRVSAKRLRYA